MDRVGLHRRDIHGWRWWERFVYTISKHGLTFDFIASFPTMFDVLVARQSSLRSDFNGSSLSESMLQHNLTGLTNKIAFSTSPVRTRGSLHSSQSPHSNRNATTGQIPRLSQEHHSRDVPSKLVQHRTPPPHVRPLISSHNRTVSAQTNHAPPHPLPPATNLAFKVWLSRLGEFLKSTGH